QKCDAVPVVAAVCRVIADLRGCQRSPATGLIPADIAAIYRILPICVLNSASPFIDAFPMFPRLRRLLERAPALYQQSLLVAGPPQGIKNIFRELSRFLDLNLLWVEAGAAQFAAAMERIYGGQADSFIPHRVPDDSPDLASGESSASRPR